MEFDGAVVINNIILKNDANYGFNAQEGEYVNMFDDTCRLMFVIGELAIRDQQACHNDVWCDESQGTSDAVSVSFLGVL